MPKFESSSSRTEYPNNFRDAVRLQRIGGSLYLVSGFGVLRVIRRMELRQETLDPFFPEFAGKESLEDLERTLDAEKERRKLPQPPEAK